MSRACRTCQHIRRPEIDRLLAAGEPVAKVARDYELNASSLHRHRVNCLKLGSSNAIMKDAARGTAAVALLPSKEALGGAYFELRARIDHIVAQAEREGSLPVALSGLNSIRHTLDSLARLAGHIGAGTQVNVAVQTNVNVEVTTIAERLIKHFDREPELKGRIAQALLAIDAAGATVGGAAVGGAQVAVSGAGVGVGGAQVAVGGAGVGVANAGASVGGSEIRSGGPGTVINHERTA
jgi:hypothetical protein